MNIKERMTCKYCNQVYNNPITLLCGDSICKHHLDELISTNSTNKFNCPICNEESLSNLEFKVSKLIESLLRTELHEFKMNPIYEEVLYDLKTEIGNLEAIVKDPENYIFEEISELKRQVDLNRERLKSDIDDLANDLIQKLESYQERFMTEYKTNIDLEHYNELFESSKKQMAEYEQCLNLFSTKIEERDEKRIQSEKIINKLELEIQELKEGLLSNLSLKYEPKEIEMNDLFGTLIIEVIFILN